MESMATVAKIAKLTPARVEQPNPHRLLAVPGKREIHPGGPTSTRTRLNRAAQPASARSATIFVPAKASTEDEWLRARVARNAELPG
jgi:hypothetical protein